jgi:hypothetical protein
MRVSQLGVKVKRDRIGLFGRIGVWLQRKQLKHEYEQRVAIRLAHPDAHVVAAEDDDVRDTPATKKAAS